LAGLKSKELNPASERPFEEAQSELDNLRSGLKIEDFDLAGEAAVRATRAFDELAAFAEEQKLRDEIFERSPQSRGASRKLAERMETDRQRMAEVQKQLKQLFPEMGPWMNDRDKEHLRQMAGEQKQLQAKARGLKQRLNEMEHMAPVFGEQAQEQMSQIGERMEQAGEGLDGRDPARAYAEEKAALDQLSEFQKQMQQNEAQSKGGKGLPLPLFGDAQRHGFNAGSAREKVEIPDADQFQAPREFRKDLLDAMKETAPESYKDQVKRYYEELVK
jgi:hypothetical protein